MNPSMSTPLNINIEPENDGLVQMIFHFQGVYSQVNHGNFLGCMFSSGEIKIENQNTPWKIIMKPKNHPLEKEHHLPNLHFCVPMLIFRSVSTFFQSKEQYSFPLSSLSTGRNQCLSEKLEEFWRLVLLLQGGASTNQ